jgi:hypothetical protein
LGVKGWAFSDEVHPSLGNPKPLFAVSVVFRRTRLLHSMIRLAAVFLVRADGGPFTDELIKLGGRGSIR